MVLMCVGSIELVWDGKRMKNGRKYRFWAFSGDMYWYTLNMYRYTLPELNMYRYMCGTCAVHSALF